MATEVTTMVRLYLEDVTILEEVQRASGLPTRSATIRWILRQYAQEHGISPEAPKAKPKRRK